MGYGRAEEDEHLVADVLLDRPTLGERDLADLTECVTEQSLHPLGTQTEAEVRRANDIDEDARSPCGARLGPLCSANARHVSDAGGRAGC